MNEQRVAQLGASSGHHAGSNAEVRPDFTVVYGEPIPDDLCAITAELLLRGLRLQIVTSRDRDELLGFVPEADFLPVAPARVDEALLQAAPRRATVSCSTREWGTTTSTSNSAAAPGFRLP